MFASATQGGHNKDGIQESFYSSGYKYRLKTLGVRIALFSVELMFSDFEFITLFANCVD